MANDAPLMGALTGKGAVRCPWTSTASRDSPRFHGPSGGGPWGDGVLSMSQATWQMLELAIRSTSNPSDAPLGQDTFGVSLSAVPGGSSSGRGEPAGGAAAAGPARTAAAVESQGAKWAAEMRGHTACSRGDGLVRLRSIPDASGESLVPFVCETAHTSIGDSDRRLGPRL